MEKLNQATFCSGEQSLAKGEVNGVFSYRITGARPGTAAELDGTETGIESAKCNDSGTLHFPDAGFRISLSVFHEKGADVDSD